MLKKNIHTILSSTPTRSLLILLNSYSQRPPKKSSPHEQMSRRIIPLLKTSNNNWLQRVRQPHMNFRHRDARYSSPAGSLLTDNAFTCPFPTDTGHPLFLRNEWQTK
ncbi:hypothetical protein CDAR_190371 [Caerostris darwini]|uniref:Uncharacterized protein n=1 Tax=Caerostris darwini TaxID=1538125 RepID=A0AAV4MPE7_9ARAC|nr:hypothetical protein CDAR_190371 [Caerostris darwini]